jgi:hypothetical protein
MTTAKTININGNMFALPEGMPAKDIQSLAGFLCSLATVRSDYNYDNSEYMYSLGDGVQVQVSDREIIPKEEAQSIEKITRDNYLTRKAAAAET